MAATLVLSWTLLLAPLGSASASASVPASTPSVKTVQTDTFVFTAVGPTRYLQVPRSGRAMSDAVEVINRTGAPVTLRLASVDANRSSSGIYGFGPSGTGFSAHVHLGATAVTLAPHAQRIIPVSIDAPGGTGPQDYAAVTAAQDTGDVAGLTVASRLAILIRVAGGAVAADPEALRGRPKPPVTLPELAVAGGIAALAIAAAGWFLLLFRRPGGRSAAANETGTTGSPIPTVDHDRNLVEV